MGFLPSARPPHRMRMARARQRLTLGDYFVLAINPALVMVLVGSLMFFLVEILYQGEFAARIRYVTHWFVVGIVAVTRVSLNAETAERAALYGLALGGAVFLALLRFVDYPPGYAQDWGWFINLFLLGIVWWTA